MGQAVDTVVNKADVVPASTELMVEMGRQKINSYPNLSSVTIGVCAAKGNVQGIMRSNKMGSYVVLAKLRGWVVAAGESLAKGSNL